MFSLETSHGFIAKGIGCPFLRQNTGRWLRQWEAMFLRRIESPTLSLREAGEAIQSQGHRIGGVRPWIATSLRSSQ
jgi:hypothetical protein